jgi:hypothetical protein
VERARRRAFCGLPSVLKRVLSWAKRCHEVLSPSPRNPSFLIILKWNKMHEKEAFQDGLLTEPGGKFKNLCPILRPKRKKASGAIALTP